MRSVGAKSAVVVLGVHSVGYEERSGVAKSEKCSGGGASVLTCCFVCLFASAVGGAGVAEAHSKETGKGISANKDKIQKLKRGGTFSVMLDELSKHNLRDQLQKYAHRSQQEKLKPGELIGVWDLKVCGM